MNYSSNFFKQFRHHIRLLLRFLAYFLALFFLLFGFWIDHNFGEPSLEQILYHMQFGMEGLVDTDIRVVNSFIQECLLTPFLISLNLLILEIWLAFLLLNRAKSRALLSNKLDHLWIKSCKSIYWLIHHRAPLYILVAGFAYFAFQFSLLTYMSQKFGSDYFAKNYLNPKQVKVKLGKPKNLVLIYVESLENSYRDDHLFGRNLLKSVDKIGGVSFNYYRQAPGTNWTIAGITATNCGIPLKSITLYDGNDQGQNIKSFLPNAICLGDILHEHGYYNVYFGGDALAFSGKGKFFEDHHYDERYGKDELKGSLTNPQMNYWGLYDDDLFVKLKAKLVDLHAKKQPFNLTFTTIDTHGPDGYFSKLCTKNGAKNFADVVECTSNQVTDFVNFIKRKGYLKDTNVVILGDHLAMYNPVYNKLEKIKERHVYNQFISLKKITKTRDHVLHFDMFPTILEFIGFHVEGGKLGLGYTAILPNIHSPNSPTPVPNEFEEMKEDLLNESETYIDLWKQGDIETHAESNAQVKP